MSDYSDAQLLETYPNASVPSSTSNLLQQMWQLHQPDLWIFGHYHNTRALKAEGTVFICLDELAYIDL